jgi:hypothetical protein
MVSARNLLTRGQRNFFIGLLVGIVIAAVVNVRLVAVTLVGLATLSYLSAVVYRHLSVHPLVEGGCSRNRDGRRSVARS